MTKDVLRAVQSVGNAIIEAYRDKGVFDRISEGMKNELGLELAERISDGNAYVVIMGEERQEPDPRVERTTFRRNVHIQELIRCINCRYTPEIDEEFIASGAVSHLNCNRLGEVVHPMGFCCWAERRLNHVECGECFGASFGDCGDCEN